MMFYAEGQYLPFSTDGSFVWPTADAKLISESGHAIALEIPPGDIAGATRMSRNDREWLGQLLAAAPDMLNVIDKLAKQGDIDCLQFFDRHGKLRHPPASP